ncbi:MAG: hypothetical protein A2234_02675 [Elusimicrobia bacterium RIFOXYA2_FULL_58_8]|nr:MAG: hypothetical protein A2285_08330 [Elusimicrobia bacterium RIFOXYA12_FULL_57_11]OGS13114.1 MAG: hypothetical protein A2234_02675 [Elusimicrobia bacterium RIFOXYA2_FULL_58_8]
MIGIGIDIGGTNTKIVAVNAAGKLVMQERFRTEAGKGAADFVRRLSAIIPAFRRKYGKKLVSIGIGAAGDVDPEKGKIRFSPNLGWRNVSLAAPLGRLTGLPCFMENDANMAAWGAFELELGRKKSTAITLTLGTGIGTGLILDGKLYHGATGSAGEAGHFKVERDGRACHCGGRGCLEAYCGSYAIMARARELVKDEAAFARRFGAPARRKFNTICLTNAAAAGNRAALRVWAETGDYLGRGLAGLILLLNPDYVVLTGGVSKAKKWFLPAMNAVLRNQQIETPFARVRVKVSDNSDLGSHGAALFGLEKKRKPCAAN